MRTLTTTVREHRHGYRYTVTYQSWCAMRARCQNEHCDQYPRYGGRGIRVCERWQTFNEFLADMGERPLGATLDRIDRAGHYEPQNCRWASRIEQARNTSRNRLITVAGQTRCLAEWADITGIRYSTLKSRLRRTPERAMEDIRRRAAESAEQP
jgi:hypothetical protein